MSLAIVAGVSVAGAAEQPIGAAKLLLRRTSSGTEKLTFVSKDPAFLFPALGGPDDPSPSGSGGLVVELFTLSTPAGVSLDAPGGLGAPGWSVRTSTPPRLQFKNAGAPASPSTFRSVTLKQGKVLKLNGKEIGLLSTPLGSVGIRITTGSLVSCARFGPTTVRKDANGTFSARNALASAISDCSDISLFGGTTTTTTTTITTTSTVTTTTTPGVCGDNVVNQSSEQCDGTDRSYCEKFDCGPPGYSTSCQCCGLYQVPTFPSQSAPCCDPGATEVYYPSIALCVTTDCSGAFECSLGQCVAGSCCAPSGNTCAIFGGGGSSAGVPCCDPAAVCVPTFPEGRCCLPDGNGCVSDFECCGSNCDGGTCSP